MEYAFEKLVVWQKSKQVAVHVYEITKEFPASEKFGLTNQMRRCSVSVGSNIAEASGRFGKKDKLRFYAIAYGSLMELLSQLMISKELTLVSQNQYADLREQLEEVSKMLNSLRSKILT